MKKNNNVHDTAFKLNSSRTELLYEFFKDPNVTVQQLQSFCETHKIPEDISKDLEDFLLDREEILIVLDKITGLNPEIDRNQFQALRTYKLIVILITNPFFLHNIPLSKIFHHIAIAFEIIGTYIIYLRYHTAINANILRPIKEHVRVSSSDFLSLELNDGEEFTLPPLKTDKPQTEDEEKIYDDMLTRSYILGRILSGYKYKLFRLLRDKAKTDVILSEGFSKQWFAALSRSSSPSE